MAAVRLRAGEKAGDSMGEVMDAADDGPDGKLFVNRLTDEPQEMARDFLALIGETPETLGWTTSG